MIAGFALQQAYRTSDELRSPEGSHLLFVALFGQDRTLLTAFQFPFVFFPGQLRKPTPFSKGCTSLPDLFGRHLLVESCGHHDLAQVPGAAKGDRQ